MKKERRVKVDLGEMVIAVLITNYSGEALLVDRDNLLSLPAGHMDLDLDGEARETAIREMFEELIGLEHLDIVKSLGSIVRNKSSPKAKLMEIIYCRTSKKEVKGYKEGKIVVWIRPLEALVLGRMGFLDESAREGIKRFVEGYPRKSVKREEEQNDGKTRGNFRKGLNNSNNNSKELAISQL